MPVPHNTHRAWANLLAYERKAEVVVEREFETQTLTYFFLLVLLRDNVLFGLPLTIKFEKLRKQLAISFFFKKKGMDTNCVRFSEANYIPQKGYRQN